jgi:hypothetical protein
MEIVKPHSKLAIASCLLAIVVFAIFVIAFGFAYFEQSFDESWRYSETMGNLRLSVYAFLMFVPIPAHLFGLILAIVSLFFPNRKKLFPILGVVLNFIFGLCGLLPYFVLAIYSMGRVQ